MFTPTEILTERRFNSKAAMQIVFEWEDVLSSALNIPLADAFNPTSLHQRVICRGMPGIARKWTTRNSAFMFEMIDLRGMWHNKKNIVPCIVDYFTRDTKLLGKFFKLYDAAPIVLISSLEAYSFLLENKCPINICHWPLSLPDKWLQKRTSPEIKKYDLILAGRTNPVLKEFATRYCNDNPHTKILIREIKGNNWICHSPSDGKSYPCGTREEYMSCLSLAKVCLYATPGIDDGKCGANGFNQVTPRLLEFLASGCTVIARYTNNPDTEFYNLNQVTLPAANYSQFCQSMSTALSAPSNSNKNYEYLLRHTTSARAESLRQILNRA